MNDERDPLLSELFAEPVALSDGTAFSERVVGQVQRSARRRRALILSLELLALVVVWLLATPLQEAIEAFLPWIMNSLVDLGDSPWSAALEPVNNLASIAALAYLLGRSAVRRLIL